MLSSNHKLFRTIAGVEVNVRPRRRGGKDPEAFRWAAIFAAAVSVVADAPRRRHP